MAVTEADGFEAVPGRIVVVQVVVHQFGDAVVGGPERALDGRKLVAPAFHGQTGTGVAQFVIPSQDFLEAALRLVGLPFGRGKDKVDVVGELVLGQEIAGEPLEVLGESVVVAKDFLHGFLRIFHPAVEAVAVVGLEEVATAPQGPGKRVLADDADGGEADLQGGV